MATAENFNPSDVKVGEAGLTSSISDSSPYTITGTAIGAGDTTYGEEEELKYWPAETLQEAAETLEGKNLVTNHNNTVQGVKGEIITSRYKDGEVQFQAELDDKSIAKKVNNNRLDVSARILHKEISELDKNEEGAYVVDLAYFDNLSLVTKPGASASNNVEMGATATMSAASLAESFDGDNVVTEEESSVDEVESEDSSEPDDQTPTEFITIPVDNL